MRGSGTAFYAGGSRCSANRPGVSPRSRPGPIRLQRALVSFSQAFHDPSSAPIEFQPPQSGSMRSRKALELRLQPRNIAQSNLIGVLCSSRRSRNSHHSNVEQSVRWTRHVPTACRAHLLTCYAEVGLAIPWSELTSHHACTVSLTHATRSKWVPRLASAALNYQNRDTTIYFGRQSCEHSRMNGHMIRRRSSVSSTKYDPHVKCVADYRMLELALSGRPPQNSFSVPTSHLMRLSMSNQACLARANHEASPWRPLHTNTKWSSLSLVIALLQPTRPSSHSSAEICQTHVPRLSDKPCPYSTSPLNSITLEYAGNPYPASRENSLASREFASNI